MLEETGHTSYSLSFSTPTTATIWYCLALIEWSVRRRVRIKLALISVWKVCICFLLQLGSKSRSRWAPSLSSSIPMIVLLCPANKQFQKKVVKHWSMQMIKCKQTLVIECWMTDLQDYLNSKLELWYYTSNLIKMQLYIDSQTYNLDSQGHLPLGINIVLPHTSKVHRGTQVQMQASPWLRDYWYGANVQKVVP